MCLRSFYIQCFLFDFAAFLFPCAQANGISRVTGILRADVLLLKKTETFLNRCYLS